MKPRDQIFRVGDTQYLKPEVGGYVLDIGNATYVSGGAGTHDDATVTFAQSASVEGDSYIKISIGASTSNVTDSGATANKYYFWDTGFKGSDCPSLCLSIDASASLTADMVQAENSGKPCIIFGWCWHSGSSAPIMEGNNGRSVDGGGNGTVNTWMAVRFGDGAGARINGDGNRGDTAFTWGTGKNTGATCRGFRAKIIANQYIRADTNASDTTIQEPKGLYYYASWHVNMPNSTCAGGLHHTGVVSTGDPVPDDHHLYVWIGAGQTVTGGDACTVAAIFKARIK